MRAILAAALAAGLLTGAARAEVVAQSDTGFQIRHSFTSPAAPAAVYAGLGAVAAWWDPAHTYSGKSENLSLSPQAGGCFCEKVGTGGVRHGVVVLALPPSTLRLEAPLGPLQGEGVATALTFSVKAEGAGSRVTLDYKVGGYNPAGVKQWASPVDQVLGVQAGRLEAYLASGAAVEAR